VGEHPRPTTVLDRFQACLDGGIDIIDRGSVQRCEARARGRID
jgi:hypothetical protein